MNEERFIKPEADALTLLIAKRLGERKRKLDRMAEMSTSCINGEKRHKQHLYAISSAAAVLFAALIVWPIYRTQMSPLDSLGIAAPTITEYRAANAEMTEIALLMEREDYNLAIYKTRKALIKSNYALKEIAGIGIDSNDEEMMYEEELEKSANSELRWTYIYLLVRLNDNKEAKRQIKIYLKDKKYSEHYTEAIALLKEIE